MSNFAGIPVILPLAGALIAIMAPHPNLVRRSALALLLVGLLGYSLWLVGYVQDEGPIVLSWGGWVVPFGIVLVADTLAGIMLCLSSLTGLACVLYGFSETPTEVEHPLRLPLLLLLIAGINLSFLTGDLFNLFVAFEVLLLSSYGLMTLELSSKRSRKALPYVTINLLASSLFLAGCAFTYSLFGTLNFAEIAVRSQEMAGDPRIGMLGLLLLFVFAIKTGLFPLYYWLPGSYSVMPPALAAFFAGMLTKVGVYLLIRLFGTVLPPDLEWLHLTIAWAAGLTMVVGVLGAAAQNRIQSILSYHIVSQVGYMALAVGLYSAFAMTAAIFYVIHHIVVKATLFLIGGIILRIQGSDDVEKTGGLWKAAPILSVVFLLQAFSLAGVPPLSGFWGKFMIIQEGLAQNQWVLVGLSLVASILTLLSMLKIWSGSFWRKEPSDRLPTFSRSSRGMTAVAAVLAVTSLVIGVGSNVFIRVAGHAAHETLDRAAYVESVRAYKAQEGKHP